MRWFHNLKISSKLLAAFLLLLALTVAMGFFGISQMGHMRTAFDAVSTNWMPSIQYASDANTNTSDFRAAEIQHVLAVEPGHKAEYERRMHAELAKLERNLERYTPLALTEEEQRALAAFHSLWKEYLAERGIDVRQLQELVAGGVEGLLRAAPGQLARRLGLVAP